MELGHGKGKCTRDPILNGAKYRRPQLGQVVLRSGDQEVKAWMAGSVHLVIDRSSVARV